MTSVLRHLDVSDPLREAVWRLAAATAAVARRGARQTFARDAVRLTPTDVITVRQLRQSTSVSGHVRRLADISSERRHGNPGGRRPVLVTRRPRAAVATGNRRRSGAAVTQRRRQRYSDVTGGR